jgi:hypothetical protein
MHLFLFCLIFNNCIVFSSDDKLNKKNLQMIIYTMFHMNILYHNRILLFFILFYLGSNFKQKNQQVTFV